MSARYSQRQPGWATVSPVIADRILVGLCAAVWLLLIGMSVAAVVALADLGSGFHGGTGNTHTSSVLYAIIIVSALIILAAIPMLLRARRMTGAEAGARPAGSAARGGSGQPVRSGYLAPDGVSQQARTERLAALRPAMVDAEIDRIWLRGSVFLLGPMGLALIAVAAATYSMATGHQGAAWTMYVIAGIITAVMPAILWRHDRRLQRLVAESAPLY